MDEKKGAGQDKEFDNLQIVHHLDKIWSPSEKRVVDVPGWYALSWGDVSPIEVALYEL